MAKKKSKLWLTLLLLAIIIAMVAFAYYQKNKKPKGEEVTFEKVEKRTILETVSASGKIFPEKEVKISSDVSGEVVNLYVAEGDSIHVGQVLAKIDPDAYNSAVERGKATLNSAKAQLSMAKSQIESTVAQKEQITAQLNNAKKIYDRNKQLFDEGIISEIELEQSATNRDNLQANFKAAQANIRSSEQSAEGNKYNIKSAEASLNELKTSLNRTIIKSPVNGIVSSLLIEKGERVVGTIQMAGTEMMRIANLNTMEVQVDVSENDILRVAVGDSVAIEVDAYLDKIFRGTVTEIANSASNISNTMSLTTDQVTNFTVKVRVDSDSYKDQITATNKYPFRPGMSATVDIFTEKMEDVIAVPIQAVTTRMDEEDEDEKKFDEVVFIHDADSVIVAKVKTGIQNDEYIQILEGLDVDQEVVSGPYSAISKKLEQGTTVRLKEDKKDKKKKK